MFGFAHANGDRLNEVDRVFTRYLTESMDLDAIDEQDGSLKGRSHFRLAHQHKNFVSRENGNTYLQTRGMSSHKLVIEQESMLEYSLTKRMTHLDILELSEMLRNGVCLQDIAIG